MLLQVLDLSANIFKQIPENIDYDNTAKILSVDPSPLNVVLLQEVGVTHVCLSVCLTVYLSVNLFVFLFYFNILLSLLVHRSFFLSHCLCLSLLIAVSKLTVILPRFNMEETESLSLSLLKSVS